MLARERLMPAPGFARRRSVYRGGAWRVSIRRGASDCSSIVSRRTAILALRCRRLACGDPVLGLSGRRAVDERFMGFLREGGRRWRRAPLCHGAPATVSA